METINILYARMICPSCDQIVETEIEMNIGDTRQRYEYTIGDKYDWRPHASVQNGGRPENGNVDAEGSSRCLVCGDNIPVKVEIRNDIIMDVFFDPDKNLSDSIPSPFYTHQPAQAAQIPPREPETQPERRPLFNFDPGWLTDGRKKAVSQLTELGVDIYAPNPSAKYDEFRIMIPHGLHPATYIEIAYLMGSPRKTIPPRAAITGTLSCTVAAWVALNPGNAVYQIVYPIPEARAPDAIAYQNPILFMDVRLKINMLIAAAKGTARMKFPAVTLVGSPAPLPRKE